MANERGFDISDVPDDVIEAEYWLRARRSKLARRVISSGDLGGLAAGTSVEDVEIPILEREPWELDRETQVARRDIESLLRILNERGKDAIFDPRFLATPSNADFAAITTHVLRSVTVAGVASAPTNDTLRLTFDPDKQLSGVLLPRRNSMQVDARTRVLAGQSPIELGIPSLVVNRGLLITLRWGRDLEFSRLGVRSSGANKDKSEARLREVALALPR